MVRAVVLNCSPRMDKGNTAMILDPFVDGMKAAGAEVEVFYTKKLRIKPCIGDFRCWSETPGECVFKDDAKDLLRRMSLADAWVFGVPVYAKLPGEVQNLLNRTMPLFEPTVVERKGALLPTKRKDVKVKRLALVSSCSYWGLENFYLVVRTFEFLGRAFDAKLARPLLRPNADVLRHMIREGKDCSGILGAAERAGAQFARTGSVPKASADAVQRPLMTKKEFMAGNG